MDEFEIARERRLLKRQPREFLPLLRCQIVDIIIEARQIHPAVRAVQRRQQLAQGIGRIRHRPAIQPAMQILVGGNQDHLHVQQPAQAIRDAGIAARKLIRVADNGNISFQIALAPLDEFFQMPASNLFFAFNQQRDVDRKPALPLPRRGSPRYDTTPALCHPPPPARRSHPIQLHSCEP